MRKKLFFNRIFFDRLYKNILLGVLNCSIYAKCFFFFQRLPPLLSLVAKFIMIKLPTSGPVFRYCSRFRPRRIYGVVVRSFRAVKRRATRINGAPSWRKSSTVPSFARWTPRSEKKKGGLSDKWVYSIRHVASWAGNSALIMIIGRPSDGWTDILNFSTKHGGGNAITSTIVCSLHRMIYMHIVSRILSQEKKNDYCSHRSFIVKYAYLGFFTT